MRLKDSLSTIKYFILPILGVFFLLWYIRAAAVDVVYSDYIRLINEYLPEVTDVSKVFVPDVLTRIPATFLARLVNVKSFGYSVTFDRLLSVVGLTLMALCISVYSYRNEIELKWQAAIAIVLFSLNKWEILLNGTAWAHVVSFGLFFMNYLVLDMIWRGETDPKQELLACTMPLIMLLFAGEYIVSYSCTIILICLLGLLTGGANSWAGKKEQSLFRHILISSSAALVLYVLSRHFAVWEHAGSTELGIADVIKQSPLFIPKFFIKTFAGTVVGQETISNFAGGTALPNIVVLMIGMAVIAAYCIAILLYFKEDMLEKTIFPLILIISGFANHVLVTMARWIFLNENYALSSRYGGQFMIGIIGIILVFALCRGNKRTYRRKGQSVRAVLTASVVFITVLIVLGNCYTTYQEINKAKYREANYEKMAAAMLDYENYPEEQLLQELEWHKDPETLYSALKILKDNKLNVFGRPHFE